MVLFASRTVRMKALTSNLLTADCLTVGCLLALGVGFFNWLSNLTGGNSQSSNNSQQKSSANNHKPVYQPPLPPPVVLGHIKSKIVGVTHANADGQKRQHLISELKVGDRLLLKREFGNQYDSFAVAVWDKKERQLGYLKKELSALIAPHVQTGQVSYATVLTLTGGTSGKELRGVNISIEDVPLEIVNRYLEQFPGKPKSQRSRDGGYYDEYEDVSLGDIMDAQGIMNMYDDIDLARRECPEEFDPDTGEYRG